MLRVSNLRKLVKPRSCPEIPINLQGTELGAPVSIGATVNVVEGQVTATGTGYDFVAGVLEVTTAPYCGVPNYTTFTISGTGPVPEMALYSTTGGSRFVLGVLYATGGLFAAYRHPSWALSYLPLTLLPGDPYELVIVVADSYVRAWLNGVSMGRSYLYADYLGPPGEWKLEIGRYYGISDSYTGHIDSIRWEVGALYPDVDNI